jgi:hypothetical protein
MSSPIQPHYADAKGRIVEGFDGNIIEAEGTTVPTDATAGYAPGCRFTKRAGTAGASLYINEGTATSCAFKALPSQAATSTAVLAVAGVAAGYKIARGVATITGSGDVATGLATVVAVVAMLQADASLTNGITVTGTIGDQAGTPAAGSVTLKVWKPTGSGDVTPIASAAAVAVNWIAVGTKDVTGGSRCHPCLTRAAWRRRTALQNERRMHRDESTGRVWRQRGVLGGRRVGGRGDGFDGRPGRHRPPEQEGRHQHQAQDRGA